jgi:uncharacterized protein (TIGR03118 family)
MKKIKMYEIPFPFKPWRLLLCFLFLIGAFGCIKEHEFPLKNYKQVNLVADVTGFGAARIDPNLGNAWGIAVAPSGALWISANHTGVSTIYDLNGATLRPPVLIPSGSKGPGAPTGQVFNNTPDFVIPSTGIVSKFIFAGEDGTLSAWSGGSAAILVANRSSFDAVYKGLAIAKDGNHNFIYVTNFKGRKIDVFDEHFNFVTNKPFSDPGIPPHFAPFNIRNISGKLYVTYAKQLAPDNEDDDKGPGNGFVDIFSPGGILLKRFASHGKLNSPWGILEVSNDFCDHANSILIGNFGDGRINVFEADGEFEGQLKDKNTPISIEGLWALENNVPGSSSRQIFFTAGPTDEEHGLFGYIERK